MAEEELPQTLLDRRIAAVQAFSDLANDLFELGGIGWVEEMEGDPRLLAVNAAVRRQLESIRAALVLSREGLGHLAVAYIRSSLEELMYLSFLLRLDRAEAQEIFLVFGRWDALRSLLAQRAYAGDDVMRTLWYGDEFLASAGPSFDEVRAELKVLQKRYSWGGLLPNGEWIADRIGERRLYDYLHSASSRAVHFSAGEVLRRSWGDPRGQVSTGKAKFQQHLANFALHQLVLLFFRTWRVLDDPSAAGVTMNDAINPSVLEEVVQRIANLGQVPLVHAHEWNLTPAGPLPSPRD